MAEFTRDEALRELALIEAAMARKRRGGRPRKKHPKLYRLLLRVTKSEHDSAVRMARRHGMTVSKLIRGLLGGLRRYELGVKRLRQRDTV